MKIIKIPHSDSFRFATGELLKGHMIRIHGTDEVAKTEICEYCARTFTTRKEVVAHVQNMHKESPVRSERVQCEICDKWLSNRYTLKDHMIRHNSEPQRCSQCDKVSPNQAALCELNGFFSAAIEKQIK